MSINNKIIYIGVLVLSILFLFIGNRIASGDFDWGDDLYAPTYYSGVVTEIIERVEERFELSEELYFVDTYTTFSVRLSDGRIVSASQSIESMFLASAAQREVEAGDRVVLVYQEFSGEFNYVNHVRINAIAVLGVVFLGLVILFGRKKGFNAIVALGFTCLAVFRVFIPAIISGRNIYAATIIVSLYAIVSTLFLVIGPNKKALSAMLGCFGGVLLAAVLMFIMDIVLGLTGVLDEETQLLLFLPIENPINLRAVVFAGVIIGAVGAIMDVAMSIASSLWELSSAGGVSSFNGIVKSGVNIGKDILGTMLNTLILAYIGSSLSLIVLIAAYSTSNLELFNMEMIIVEFLRALVGSFGMLLTIPLTAGVCGWMYSRKAIAN